MNAFNIFTEKLINSPVMIAPEWLFPFEITCNASDFAVRAALGQRKDKYFRPIYYASKILMEMLKRTTPLSKKITCYSVGF